MKSIITTVLLGVAAVSANAWTTAQQSQIWMQNTETMTYEYTEVSKESLVPANGGYTFWESQGISAAQDINSPVSTKIDFSQDARYEFKFNVSFWGTSTNGALPYCNLTLVTSSNDASILFGNADDNHCQFGVIPNRDVTATPGEESLCVNSAGTLVYSTSWTTPMTTGFYEYTLIFETFSDAATEDKIYFGIKNTGTGQSVSMLRANASHLGLGGSNSKVFDDIGFSIYGADFTSEGGTDTVGGQGGVKLLSNGSTLTTWTRTATPVEEPEVPEPSAFGLLAGLGAIALAVSRRRRSR